MDSTPQFQLRLFGSPAIVQGDGTLLSGRAVHRHRLALLALLALAPGRTLRREKAQGTLWPESDAEHARQLLNQAVYSLRRALGEEAILTAGDELRFNPAVLGADVQAFESALAAGQLEQAVRLYGGPLLDGFYLDDAPEFEHWVDGTRARLAAEQARALETLAERAGQARRPAEAVEWWRALATHSPYDSRVALRYMQALDASGNRAGALQHAVVHHRMLEAEFGAEPDPQVLALAERLRREPAPLPDQDPEAPPPAAPEPTQPREAAPPGPVARPAPPGAAIPPVLPRRRLSAARIGVALLILAVVVVAALQFGDAPGPAAPPPSIAVLPLQNLSPDPADAALADGMTDALIAMLARTGGLRVVASTSLARFRDRLADVRWIADTLGVGNILEGSFQVIGTRLRVSLRLVDGADGSTRWSAPYDREFADVFEVQDEIALAVARELGLRLTGEAASGFRQPPTRSVAAYELYLRGSDRTLLRSDSTARLGLEYFRQAIALDSTYAAAWAGLGRMYGRVSSTVPAAERRQSLVLAEEAARRAIALDDSLAEGHATLGALRMLAFDFAAAERHLRRAIALDPASALIHEWMVSLYLWTEQPATALAHAEQALAIDPLSPTAHAELARALLANDRCDEALGLLAPLSNLRPPLLRAVPLAAECHARQGRWPEAIALLQPSAETGVRLVGGQLGLFQALAGRREEAARTRATLLDRVQRGESGALEVALVTAGLGELDQAFTWLERAIDDLSLVGGPGHQSHLLLTGPFLADLRRDPRFDRLRERLGLPPR